MEVITIVMMKNRFAIFAVMGIATMSIFSFAQSSRPIPTARTSRLDTVSVSKSHARLAAYSSEMILDEWFEFIDSPHLPGTPGPIIAANRLSPREKMIDGSSISKRLAALDS